jgi:polyhydroxyalkanoate synthase
MPLEPTPKDTLFHDGTARVLRFRGATRAEGAAPAPGAMPLLLVPSMINRWYVLDLRPGASLAGSLVSQGLDTWCLDWGIPEDEDRYLRWDEVLDRLARAVRFVRRSTGAPRVGLLGYCMGATLAGIFAALHPDQVAAFVNLAGPFDFAEGGLLSAMVDPRWFDAGAVADAGNVAPVQMQSGFVALRPTQQLAKMMAQLDRGHDPKAREAFDALEEWASDNIPFPAEAYRTYITELYQQNLLVRGEHRVRGRRVDLGAIRCPLLTVTADRDTIGPPSAAQALADRCGSTDREAIAVPGGHVGAVVGSRAQAVLYPAIGRWLRSKLCN